MKTTRILTTAAAASAITLGGMSAAQASEVYPQDTTAAHATATDPVAEPGVGAPEPPAAEEPAPEEPPVSPAPEEPAPEEPPVSPAPEEPAPEQPAPVVPAPEQSAPVVPTPAAPVPVVPQAAAQTPVPAAAGAATHSAGSVVTAPPSSSQLSAPVSPAPHQDVALPATTADPAVTHQNETGARHVAAGAAGAAGSDFMQWAWTLPAALGTALLGRGALSKRATARHRATGK